MTIRGICPECGMSADLAAFVTQGEHNQALAAALEIPAILGPRVVRYLGLHRPPSRALAGAKAVRLLAELRDTITSGRIERKGVSRPAPLQAWIAAFDQILERPPSKLPLSGHGYLYEVVATEADRLDAQAEKQREEAARSGAKPGVKPAAAAIRERSTEDVLAEHQRLAAQGKGGQSSHPGPAQRRGQHSIGQLLKGAPGAEDGDA
ncbi:hypothetical protein [Billgrantia gudaonensis]|uniref:DUF2752 domain-containing protein n=1 Tax=Billgrantia gudaonensis TaxID=376427 RepID=A0A1G9AW49_9GAMM|nr:hypothetical protein [Halomonas gudaonensis]SDK30880.1 hypothetical protein SAMN04487954_11494 [Halomonas gudaonensis]